MDETQEVLGELRRVRRAQEEMALQLRIDTPWVKAQEHVDHALKTLQKIPLMARVFCFLGVCLVGASALYRNLRLFFIGLDVLFASLLFVGGP